MNKKIFLEKKLLQALDKNCSIKVKQSNLQNFGFKFKKNGKLCSNKDIKNEFKNTKTLLDFGFSSQ